MVEFTEHTDIFGEPLPVKKECKGQVYRGRVSKYLNANGILTFKEELRPLKRKSCMGCERCDYLTTELNEFLCMDNAVYAINQKGDTVDIKEGKLYRLMIGNESRDWETGYIDDYDLQFLEIKE